MYPAPLHELLPDFVVDRLRAALIKLDKRMPGFASSNSMLVGVESRTSSPIKIPRDPTTRMHPDIKGLFPCGEGAGYAGGILSAAIDGQNVAAAVAECLKSK